MLLGLLAAEIRAVTGQDPGQLYQTLTQQHGTPYYARTDAPATREQKARLGKIKPQQVHRASFAGEKIERILTHAPGDDNPLGGIKVMTRNAWFAARPSGTEDVYKIYAESFLGADHLQRVQWEAQALVDEVLGA
jgi:phosphoglucomutase